MKSKICECCGAFFEQDSPNQRYCSVPCQKLIKHKTDYNRLLRRQLQELRAKLKRMKTQGAKRIALEEKIARTEATIRANDRIIGRYDQRGLDCNERTEYENYMPAEAVKKHREELARRCGCLSPQNN